LLFGEVTMRKENRWMHGTTSFVFPPLAENVRGSHGCALHRMIIDPAIGEEICAVYMEDPAYVNRFSKVRPFNLVANTGLVRTPHGVVGFIVWHIAARSSHEVMVEQYLNPQNIGTIRLVTSAANQTHFKLIVVNNQTAEIAAFVDYENVFEFDRLASQMALAIGPEPEGDFAAASHYVMETKTVPELVALGSRPIR
jgi:hypothetical protein